MPDEVAEVAEVLWAFHSTHAALFAHYAASAGSDLQTMTFNGWLTFVNDLHLDASKSKFCKAADLDRIFIAVDARSVSAQRSTPRR